MVPAEARASAGCLFGEVISAQISAIRGQEKDNAPLEARGKETRGAHSGEGKRKAKKRLTQSSQRTQRSQRRKRGL
jgi:hypothetical protein